jgi:hypothetical protein
LINNVVLVMRLLLLIPLNPFLLRLDGLGLVTIPVCLDFATLVFFALSRTLADHRKDVSFDPQACSRWQEERLNSPFGHLDDAAVFFCS